MYIAFCFSHALHLVYNFLLCFVSYALFCYTVYIDVIHFFLSLSKCLETIYQALIKAFQCCQDRARMILGGDFNCRLDSAERGNLLCEFLINWNLHCVNDNGEITYEFQCGKSVINLFFVSRELLEHFNETKIKKQSVVKMNEVAVKPVKIQKDSTNSIYCYSQCTSNSTVSYCSAL